MFSLAVACAAIALTSPSHAQPAFSNTYSRGIAEGAKSAVITSDGQLLVGGWTKAASGFDTDMWVVKLTPGGEPVWDSILGGLSRDEVSQLVPSADGGCVILATTSGFGSAQHSFLLIKLDSGGTVQWQRSMIVSGRDWGQRLEPTADGGYLLVGATDPRPFLQNNQGLVLKLDPAGQIEWARSLEGSGWHHLTAARSLPGGHYLVAGNLRSADSQAYEGLLLELDAHGEILWQRAYAMARSLSFASLALSGERRFVAGTVTSERSAGIDAVVLEVDATGEPLAARTYGSAGDEGFTDMQPTRVGGLVAVGSAPSTSGGQDLWAVALDAEGRIEWQTASNGSSPGATANSVLVLPEGGYVLTGASDPGCLLCQPVTSQSRFTVVRLLADGRIPPSFDVELTRQTLATMKSVHCDSFDSELGTTPVSITEAPLSAGDLKVDAFTPPLIVKPSFVAAWEGIDPILVPLGLNRAGPLEPADPDLEHWESQADARWNAGDLIGSRETFQAIYSRLKAASPGTPRAALGEHDLAVTLHAMGDLASAERLYGSACVAFESARLGASHAVCASQRSSLLLDMGRLREAAEAGQQAIRLSETIDDHAANCTVLNNLARVLVGQGHHTEARASLERARASCASLEPGHPERTAIVLRNLAALELARSGDGAPNDTTGVQGLLGRALELQRGVLPASHPQLATTRARIADMLQRVGPFPAAHAALLFGRGRVQEALAASLQADDVARMHLRLAARTLPERQALALAPATRVGLDLTLSAAAALETREATKDAWDALVRSRLLILEALAARARAGRRATSRQEIELRERHHRIEDELARGQLESRGSPPRELVEEKELLERSLAEIAQSMSEGETRSPDPGLDAVLQELPADAALVSYVEFRRSLPPVFDEAGRAVPVGTYSTERHYAAFVVRGQDLEPRLLTLGSAKTIDALVADWQRAVRKTPSPTSSPPRVEADYLSTSRRLREAIWDPLIPRLDGARRVFIVPDGALHLLNWNTLPAEPSGYLIEGPFVLHHLSTELRLLEAEPADRIVGGELLAVGDPDFGTPLPEFASNAFEPLPLSRGEVERVAELWGRSRATILTGRHAGEEQLTERLPGHRVIHLATHGIFRGPEEPQDPAASATNVLPLSGVALAGANTARSTATEGTPGVLTSAEIVAIDLSAVDLVVLSACDTGAGIPTTGEGLLGLRRALEIAGARSQVLSLWRVRDDVALDWILRFYRVLLRGSSTGEAARDANLEALRRRRSLGQSTHPSFWGAFLATGGGA